MKKTSHILLLSIATVFLAGCSTTPIRQDNISPPITGNTSIGYTEYAYAS